MKNLTKRNLIVLAIAAVLVIAVIALVAFNQVGGSQLSGTVAFAILPSNPTVVAGRTVKLSVPQVLGACSWSSSNTAVASVAAGACSSFSATVTGVAAGKATITVTYAVAGGLGGMSTATTTVTVLPPPTPTPPPTATPRPTPDPWLSAGPLDPGTATIHLAGMQTFATAARECTWSVTDSTVLSVVVTGVGTYTRTAAVYGLKVGSAEVRANCWYETGVQGKRKATVTVIP